MTYRNYRHVENAITEFEDLIGMPFEQWVRDMAAEGYGQYWMSEKSGVGSSSIKRFMDAHGIERSKVRVGSRVGTMPGTLRWQLHRLGLTNDRDYKNLLRMQARGLTFDQAVERMKKLKEPTFADKLREVGLYTHAGRSAVRLRMDRGMTFDQAVADVKGRPPTVRSQLALRGITEAGEVDYAMYKLRKGLSFDEVVEVVIRRRACQ